MNYLGCHIWFSHKFPFNAIFVMNFVLNTKQYPMLDISYERRNRYFNAPERSQVKKNKKTFLKWFAKRYIQENKQYLE
ncbi:MAG TPA: hypothetical protein VMW74_02355 [Nitrosopumilaceae archaeon]|nr:hypothetical protein [Nitrosopumilaceae archaeon]